MNVEKAQAEKHYADLSSKPFFPALVDYICSGPVVAMVRWWCVWEGCMHGRMCGKVACMGAWWVWRVHALRGLHLQRPGRRDGACPSCSCVFVGGQVLRVCMRARARACAHTSMLAPPPPAHRAPAALRRRRPAGVGGQGRRRHRPQDDRRDQPPGVRARHHPRRLRRRGARARAFASRQLQRACRTQGAPCVTMRAAQAAAACKRLASRVANSVGRNVIHGSDTVENAKADPPTHTPPSSPRSAAT
jgi:hypothetical protein